LASISLLSLEAVEAPFSFSHWAVRARRWLLELGSACARCGRSARPLRRCRRRLLPQRLALDLELHDPPAQLVEFLGMRIVLDAQREAASSIRSIALSGRNRSVM
jgi:hypothetical protein